MNRRVVKRSRSLVALLLASLVGLAGLNCPHATIVVQVVPSASSVPAGGFFTVDLVVDADSWQVQAWDFEVQFDPTQVVATGAVDPHPNFDDDGSLLVTPALDLGQGTLGPVVDLRHGPPATGRFVAATIHFQAVAGAGTSWVTVAGDAATPNGTPMTVNGIGELVTLTP